MINELNKQLEDLKNRIDGKKNEMNSRPSININISNINSNNNISNNNQNETESGRGCGSGIGNNNNKKNIYNRNNRNLCNNSQFFVNYANEQISIDNKKYFFISEEKKK